MPKERYEDLLDYRLKELEKSKKAQREASSFYIVTSNRNKEINKYYSFDEIPIEVREDKYDYEIMKIRYELTKGTIESNKFAPRIVWRTGCSYYEKLIYNNLIKRGYKENQDFEQEFQGIEEDIKAEFPDITQAELVKVKNRLNDLAFSEAYHTSPLKFIYKGLDEFRSSSVVRKKTAETSSTGKRDFQSASKDFASWGDEEIKNASRKDFEEYSKWADKQANN